MLEHFQAAHVWFIVSIVSGVEEIRKTVVPLVDDARANAKTTLQDMMNNFKKRKSARELSYDEEVDGEALKSEEDPAKEVVSKAKKAKGKAKAKAKASAVPKSEGDTLDPKKVTSNSKPQT